MNSSFKTMTLVSALATSAMLTSGTLLPSANATCVIDDSDSTNTFNNCNVEGAFEVKIYGPEEALERTRATSTNRAYGLYDDEYKIGSEVYLSIKVNRVRRGREDLFELEPTFNMDQLLKQNDDVEGSSSFQLNPLDENEHTITFYRFNLNDEVSSWYLRENQQIFGRFTFRKGSGSKRKLDIRPSPNIDRTPEIQFTSGSSLYISTGVKLTSRVPISFENYAHSKIWFEFVDKDNHGQLVVVSNDGWTIPSLDNIGIILAMDASKQLEPLVEPIVLLKVQKEELDSDRIKRLVKGTLTIGDGVSEKTLGAPLLVSGGARNFNILLSATNNKVLLESITELAPVAPPTYPTEEDENVSDGDEVTANVDEGSQEVTENPDPPAPQEVTENPVAPAPQEVTENPVAPAPQEVTENPVTPAPQEVTENPDPPAASTQNASGEIMILNNLWSETGMAYGDQVGTKVRFDWFSGLNGAKNGWAINVTASGEFSYANVDFNATLHYHRLTVDSAVDDLLAGIFKVGTSQTAGLVGHGYLGIGAFLAKNTNRLAYLVGGELGYNFILDEELSFSGVVIKLKPELQVNLAVASNIKDSTVLETDTNVLFNSAFGMTAEFARNNDFADVSYSFIVPLYGTVTVERKVKDSTTSVVGSFRTGLGFNLEYKEFFVTSVNYNLEVDKSYVKNSIGVNFQFKL